MTGEISSRRAFLKLGSAGLAAGLAGCRGILSAGDTPESRSSPSPANTPEGDSQSQVDGSVYTGVYRETIDSVVSVSTDRGQGTGFVFDDTHVVTNAHVVVGASETQIRFNDGTWSDGTVVGTDSHSDLAAIEVASVPDAATALSFQQAEPTIGQRVVAIGNPFDLDGTVTTGIVSGTDRLIPAPTGYRIPDAIQTDAAVNPGNSGGPLMTVDGSVVGVVNSKRGDNIAFGISAALTRRVVPRLVETGSYEHAYLGASIENVTPTIAEPNDVTDPRGMVVVQTADGGPADGVLRGSELRIVDGSRVPVGGDVVLAIDGTRMNSFEDLASYLALHTQPGDRVRMRILRNGSERTVELELGSRPEGSSSPLG